MPIAGYLSKPYFKSAEQPVLALFYQILNYICLKHKKTLLRKILHIALIFSLLNATFGFSVSKHFCGEILQNTAVNAEAAGCCGEEKDAPNDCCSDTEEIVRMDDELQKPAFSYEIPAPVFARISPAPGFTLRSDIVSVTDCKSAFLCSRPPLSGRQRQILFLQFLV